MKRACSVLGHAISCGIMLYLYDKQTIRATAKPILLGVVGYMDHMTPLCSNKIDTSNNLF